MLVGYLKAESNALSSSIEEMEMLSRTAGFLIVETVTQCIDSPGYVTYLGSGKIESVASLISKSNAEAVITRHNLKPAQVSTLEKTLGTSVLDRTQLILQIFSNHAVTTEGKYEVELARLKYELPRLAGAGHSLSQTGGGIGTRGPGEQLLEMNRRKILRRIGFLKSELENLRTDREVTRKKRMRSNIPIVSFVGYTNAGKSTIVSALSSCNLLIADKLFSTLDTRTKRAVLGTGRVFLATDTVGFIRDLPVFLMQSFRSTLEEAAYSDLVIKVVDASDAFFKSKLKTVDDTLKEINADAIPYVTVFNKIDLCTNSWLEELETAFPEAIFISAARRFNLEELEKAIEKFIQRDHAERAIEIDQDRVSTFMKFRNQMRIISEEYQDGRIKILYSASEKIHRKLVSSLKEVRT